MLAVRRVLAFGAHPDDVELQAGGTLAAWAARGARVEVACFTAGEKGSHDPAADPGGVGVVAVGDAEDVDHLAQRDELGAVAQAQALSDAAARRAFERRTDLPLARPRHDRARHHDHVVVVALGEPATVLKLAGTALIVVGVVALNLSGAH